MSQLNMFEVEPVEAERRFVPVTYRPRTEPDHPSLFEGRAFERTKRCKHCHQRKPLAEMAIKKGKHIRVCRECARRLLREWRLANLDHCNEYARNYWATHPEFRAKASEWGRRWYENGGNRILRDRYLQKTFHITLEQYEAMAAAQGYICAMCKEPEKNGKDLSVDHDHSCCPGRESCGKCIRALVCGRCNCALGLLDDSIAKFSKGIDYLNRFEFGSG